MANFSDYVYTLMNNISPTGGMLTAEQQDLYDRARAYSEDPFRKQNEINKAAQQAAVEAATERALVDPLTVYQQGGNLQKEEAKSPISPSPMQQLKDAQTAKTAAGVFPGIVGTALQGLIGYDQGKIANALIQDMEDKYGVTIGEKSSPLVNSLLGIVGMKGTAVEDALNFASLFGDQGLMEGYLALNDPTIAAIADPFGMTGRSLGQLAGIGQTASEGYKGLLALGYTEEEAQSAIRGAIENRNEMQAPAPVVDIGGMLGYVSGGGGASYGGGFSADYGLGSGNSGLGLSSGGGLGLGVGGGEGLK